MKDNGRYLFCTLASLICLAATDDGKGTTPASEVPRIDIVTQDSVRITSKTDYIAAAFSLQGNGLFDEITDSVYIRGRGNTSWSAYPKKSYRLKFFHKQALFGAATRHYVLLANYLDPTLAINAAAMETARLVGCAFTGHAAPAELYLNGDYLGSYLLTEKIRVGKGSVDLDKERGVLLELDVNFDEPQRFVSGTYHLPVMIHHPTPADTHAIATRWNTFEQAVRDGSDLTALVDTAALVRYLFVYDLFCNNEVGHPKSVFCFYERSLPPAGTGEASPITFGPVWDFDWSCGYLGERYFEPPFLEPYEQGQWFPVTPVADYVGGRTAYNGYPFFDAIAHHPQVKGTYARFCYNSLSGGLLSQLLSFIDHYTTVVAPSAEHDATLWPNTTHHAANTEGLMQWLTARAEVLLSHSLQVIEEEETAILPTKAYAPASPLPWHTLDGRPLPHSAGKGIYILPDGKKVWIR